MPNQGSYSGTVTRKSSGTIEFTPTDAGVFNTLPEMGDEVTISFEVTRTANEIERANAEAKAARLAAAETPGGAAGVVEAQPAASAPVVERRAPRR